MIPPYNRKVICTVGPASLKPRLIRRLEKLGISLFRINLSHTTIEEVRPAIAFLLENTTVPVCLDSEGAQVRTGTFAAPPTNLKKTVSFRFTAIPFLARQRSSISLLSSRLNCWNSAISSPSTFMRWLLK